MLLLVPAFVAALPGPARAQPYRGRPIVIDGPGAAIQRPSGLGLSIARDGTGGLVYLKQAGAATHVFVSRLVGGAFQHPQQLDTGGALLGPSSQPVIAAGNGGVLVVSFINGGRLYVVQRPSAAQPYTAPIALYGGAANPALEMTNFGKAYLAFTAGTSTTGYAVRAAYYYRGRWALEPTPLNATPGGGAGTGSGRPKVAAAGDGVAIVAWGENGHIYSRRVWGTSPSVVYEQADVPPPGCSELSADEPVVAAGGDSSYAGVAFHETVSCGGQPQSRVLMRRLHGSIYDPLTQPDGLSRPGAEGAEDPQIAMTEYGHGFVTSDRTQSHDLFARVLGDNGQSEGLEQVNAGSPNASSPHGVPAVAGLFSTLIAWQHDPGGGGVREIRVRYSPDSSPLEAPYALSDRTQGSTDAASGLAAGGDSAGEAAVAWIQGSSRATEVVVGPLYQAPGSFGGLEGFSYARTAHPVLRWSAVRANWGPVRYTVTIDGSYAGRSTGTSLVVRRRLRDGRHVWRVSATNPIGLHSSSRNATVFVDTVAPTVNVTVRGSRRAGSPLALTIRYRDRPPRGRPARVASGVAKVKVNWGDRRSTSVRPGRHGAAHDYRRPGRYKVTVLVTDRAGNVRRWVRYMRIASASGSSGG